ncbi:MAG: hypothetical protein KF716_12655 [Anaerolineae bacterium]|nr:hypothetical protein [Anaerolineae bacterium]
MELPQIVHRTVTKLVRAEIAGVNPHTLAVALQRLAQEALNVEQYNERYVGMLLLDRAVYPESPAEMNAFLAMPITLSTTTLTLEEITDLHAPVYLRWVAGFLNDPDANIQKNARILLKWLVANRQKALAADQTSLENIRQIADDPESVWRSSAYIVYALGSCGVIEDYDRVIFHAEKVIEHDRENIEMVAEALYRLHPPALINVVKYFLDTTEAPTKQFTAGLHLLAKVSEIDNRDFWKTYYDDMDQIVVRLNKLIDDVPAVERIVDQMEKHLALAYVDDEG